MTTVLFVVTGSDHWTLAGGTQRPTGCWAEELAAPHRLFREPGSTSPSPHPAAWLRRISGFRGIDEGDGSGAVARRIAAVGAIRRAWVSTALIEAGRARQASVKTSPRSAFSSSSAGGWKRSPYRSASSRARATKPVSPPS